MKISAKLDELMEKEEIRDNPQESRGSAQAT
jgi:hypothetical protein